MRIGVLVKQVPDTWADRRIDLASGRVDRAASPAVLDEICEYAIEVALRAREANGGDVIALSMGPAGASEVLRRALEMGADDAVLINDDRLAGADLTATAFVLAAVLRSHSLDLVITGTNSTDGRAGILQAMIAEHLGVPLLDALDSVEISDHDVRGARAVDGGEQQVRADLPVVLTTTERASEPRVPGLRDVMRARKKKPLVQSLGDLSIEPPISPSQIVSSAERPPRVAGPRERFSAESVRAVVDLLADRRVI